MNAGDWFQTAHALLYHVKQANFLMRAEDLNNDGESDCVGLHVQDLRIITDPRISVESLGHSPGTSGFSSNYWAWSYPSQTLSPEDYIRMFSK